VCKLDKKGKFFRKGLFVHHPSDPPASPERATGSRWRAGAVFPLPSVSLKPLAQRLPQTFSAALLQPKSAQRLPQTSCRSKYPVVPHPSDPPASPERATGSRWRAGAIFLLPSVSAEGEVP